MNYEILVDHSETANKCTILPLAYRSDFRIRRVTAGKILPLHAQFLLHPEGEVLSLETHAGDRQADLAAIDCIWRRLAPIMQLVATPIPRLVRIPEGFVTAYPRKSRLSFDPPKGLATIEALFIAAALLGNWDETLLREYYFAREFLALNRTVFESYGVMPPPPTLLTSRIAQTSRDRRLARGRGATPQALTPRGVSS